MAYRRICMASSIAAVCIAAVGALGNAKAAPEHGTGSTATAHFGSLVLSITVRVNGASVTAHAKLTNSGTTAWKYYGACAPPILQIQARDENGQHLSGWTPPRISCGALSLLHLGPGKSLKATATFPGQGRVFVKALVPVIDTSAKKFATREVSVTAPAAWSR